MDAYYVLWLTTEPPLVHALLLPIDGRWYLCEDLKIPPIKCSGRVRIECCRIRYRRGRSRNRSSSRMYTIANRLQCRGVILSILLRLPTITKSQEVADTKALQFFKTDMGGKNCLATTTSPSLISWWSSVNTISRYYYGHHQGLQHKSQTVGWPVGTCHHY